MKIDACDRSPLATHFILTHSCVSRNSQPSRNTNGIINPTQQHAILSASIRITYVQWHPLVLSFPMNRTISNLIKPQKSQTQAMTALLKMLHQKFISERREGYGVGCGKEKSGNMTGPQHQPFLVGCVQAYKLHQRSTRRKISILTPFFCVNTVNT